MRFEYNPAKSSLNKDKHGIDFDEAQQLWDDPSLVEANAKVGEEPRFLAVGKIGSKHWAAIFTHRESNRRIISVRRARSEEIDQYENG